MFTDEEWDALELAVGDSIKYLYGIGNSYAAKTSMRLSEKVRAVRAQQGWQPIETAPRDGTSVLVYDEGPILVACYDSHDDVPGWYETNGLFNPPPTHWMPLPAPPVEQGEGQ